MSEQPHAMPEFEPERYELYGLPSTAGLDRRQFLAMAGGGLLILVTAGPIAAAQRGGRRGGGGGGGAISAWLHVGADEHITVFTGKVELGQNIRTELTQVVAEEVHAAPGAIRLIMGDTDLTPWDAGTFGSQTTPNMVPQLRRAAAAARLLLAKTAAEKWQVDPSTVTVENGTVRAASGGKSATFGELTQGRKLVETVGDPALTPATEWKVAGKSLPKVGGAEFVTGAVKYASDVKRPGMLYGKVVHPPRLGDRLVSVDTAAAEKMPGVRVVRDGDLVGVVASDSYTAGRAVDAIRPRWETGAQLSEGQLFAHLRQTGGEGRVLRSAGAVATRPADAAHTLRRTYTLQYIAHVPLEPRTGVAEWGADGRLTVWTGTQRPFGNKTDLAAACGIPEERVRVFASPVGGAYGGKQTCEAAIEAARLAKAVGKPVSVTWTREDEFRYAYFRPAGVIDISAAIDAQGKLLSWEFHNYNSGTAGIETSYDCPNQRIVFHSSQSPLRQGSYRALAAPGNQFARETHMDELAELVHMDALEFRLANLSDERFRAVLQAAARQFGWGKPAPKGHGFGIAGGFEKMGYSATCAEVAVDPKTLAVRLVRVVTAFDGGAIISPDLMRNQIEGMQMMGLGGALFEAIHFENGKIANPRLSKYRVPRFSDMPVIESILMHRRDLVPVGGGECPMVCIAPAIGSAIRMATGIRLRGLPLAPDGVRA